jgi:peptidoglycan/LPS O-acetylase OafA/YrhL
MKLFLFIAVLCVAAPALAQQPGPQYMQPAGHYAFSTAATYTVASLCYWGVKKAEPQWVIAHPVAGKVACTVLTVASVVGVAVYEHKNIPNFNGFWADVGGAGTGALLRVGTW